MRIQKMRERERGRERANRRRNTQTMLTARNYVKYACLAACWLYFVWQVFFSPSSPHLSLTYERERAYKSQLSQFKGRIISTAGVS